MGCRVCQLRLLKKFFWISDEQLEAASDENDLAQQEHMAFAGSNCDKCFSPMSGQRVMSVILSVTLFSVLFNLSRWFELEATQIEVSALKSQWRRSITIKVYWNNFILKLTTIQ